MAPELLIAIVALTWEGVAFQIRGVNSRDATSLSTEDRVALCSLRQHASAEVAQLKAGDSSVLNCGSAMDVAPRGTAYLNMLQWTGAPAGQTRRVIWVTGFPRSSTSTVLSMVSAGQTEFTDDTEKTYSLFEPCHDGDEYDLDTINFTRDGCGPVLHGITRCEFYGVKKLWGWTDPHSTRNKGEHVNAQTAGRLCEEADLVAFKTVDYGHKLRAWEWFLDENPDMHVLAVVRDPRGIYASWKTMEPFKTLVNEGRFYTPADICEAFADNLDFNHSRVHNVVFENLVSEPFHVTKQVYGLVGLPISNQTRSWLHSTFNAKECPEPPPWEVGYTDCHTDSKAVADKWRTVLTQEELDTFNNNAACRKVIEHYGYSQ